jgi:hypothetical protein
MRLLTLCEPHEKLVTFSSLGYDCGPNPVYTAPAHEADSSARRGRDHRSGCHATGGCRLVVPRACSALSAGFYGLDAALRSTEQGRPGRFPADDQCSLDPAFDGFGRAACHAQDALARCPGWSDPSVARGVYAVLRSRRDRAPFRVASDLPADSRVSNLERS